jgi:hypothetical protein
VLPFKLHPFSMHLLHPHVFIILKPLQSRIWKYTTEEKELDPLLRKGTRLRCYKIPSMHPPPPWLKPLSKKAMRFLWRGRIPKTIQASTMQDWSLTVRVPADLASEDSSPTNMPNTYWNENSIESVIQYSQSTESKVHTVVVSNRLYCSCPEPEKTVLSTKKYNRVRS